MLEFKIIYVRTNGKYFLETIGEDQILANITRGEARKLSRKHHLLIHII